MEFRILGPVEVTVSGRPLAIPARARDVLATLLVHANHVVSADQLTAELWPDHPADKSMGSLQVRISGLRKLLAQQNGPAEDRLTTQAPGYLIRVQPDELDASRFEDLTARAQDARQPQETLEYLNDALALWRGAALAGTDAPSARAEASRLEELRLAALEARTEVLVECGKLGDAIAELDTLTQAHPLRERLWHTKMLALYRSGRQADALCAYREVRAIMADELAVEPGPPLRELHARVLRQDPALDDAGTLARRPRWDDDGVTVRVQPRFVPDTKYALTDDGVHIAYQVLGQGPRDIVFVPGLMSHLELLWEDDDTAGFFRRLATLGRLILFDKRDTGLSDRASGDLSLAERMADVQAVMRAAGSARAVLFGYSEGAPMSILLAATSPSLVTALILGSASARWFPAPDYPCGAETEVMFAALRGIAANRWGQGDSIDWYLPSLAGSAHARELFARFERLAVNPGAFLRMTSMIRDIDVRWALPSVHVPTLVIQRLGDRITPEFHGRYLASHIAGARYFEQPGDHALRFAGSGDSGALFTVIADFLAAMPPSP